MLPRAVEVLWSSIAASDQPCGFAVSLTAAEIYCERIRQAGWHGSCAAGQSRTPGFQESFALGRHAPPISFAVQNLTCHCQHLSLPTSSLRILLRSHTRFHASLQSHVTAATAALLLPSLRDLLDLSNDNLGVTADRVRGVVLPGAAELPAAGPAQLLAGLRTALANRVVGATAMNAGALRVDDVPADTTLPMLVAP